MFKKGRARITCKSMLAQSSSDNCDFLITVTSKVSDSIGDPMAMFSAQVSVEKLAILSILPVGQINATL